MSEEPASPISRPFRILWNDRLVASFESATGLDPWGRRVLRDVGGKVLGDVQDQVRAMVIPGALARDEGSWHTVTFQSGTIGDPAFAAWAGSADDQDEEQAGDAVDLRIDVVGPDGERLDRYVLRRCSVRRFVARARARSGTVRVTRLEVGCAGWDWDAPDHGALAGSEAARPGDSLPLRRSCWKGVAAGAAIGVLVASGILAPRLRSGAVSDVAVGSERPIASPPAVPEPGAASPPNVVKGIPPVVAPPRGKPSAGPTPSPTGTSPSPLASASSPSPSATPPGRAPVAADDAYATYYETPLSEPAPGVLANDQDPDGPALTARLFSQPANGSVSLNSDGSFTYTPAAYFYGTDTFTYQAVSGGQSSKVATVTITVYAS